MHATSRGYEPESLFSLAEHIFGVGRCLNLEHLILEVNRIFEEPFLNS